MRPNLKTLDTNGYCQRPVFLLGVSQHMHKQTCENLSSIGHQSCEIIMKEETPLSLEVVCFQMLDFETSNSKSEVSKSNSWKITSFSKNYVTSEGAVSHNVLYYQQLPVACYQVIFYANNYSE